MRVAAIALSAALLLAQTKPGTDVDALLDRAAAYVAKYENDAGVLTAEETYVQSIVSSAVGSSGNYGERKEQRTLKSDFLMVKPAGDEPWMGLRQVHEVSDKPVERVRDVKELAARFTDWSSLNSESARYNLGPPRTINVPMFALVFVKPQQRKRFTFKKDGGEKIRDVDTVRVTFDHECCGPTLIRDTAGRNVQASGALWIDPKAGTVLRTELTTVSGLMRGRVTVDYRLDEPLGLWVPLSLREAFTGPYNLDLKTLAEYSNYRRFQVETRIKD
jgi:hypothetical protein